MAKKKRKIHRTAHDCWCVELDNAHKYYQESIRMTLRVPAISASVFVGLLMAYGLTLRALASCGDKCALQEISVVLLIIPWAGIFVGTVSMLAQYVSISAMHYSSDTYLKPNRKRLGFPVIKEPKDITAKFAMKVFLFGLFFAGYIGMLVVWWNLK